MIVKRSWSVTHTGSNGSVLQARSSDTDLNKLYIGTVDPEIEEDENVEFDMTIEELEAFVKTVRAEYDANKARVTADAAEVEKANE